MGEDGSYCWSASVSVYWICLFKVVLLFSNWVLANVEELLMNVNFEPVIRGLKNDIFY